MFDGEDENNETTQKLGACNVDAISIALRKKGADKEKRDE